VNLPKIKLIHKSEQNPTTFPTYKHLY